MNNFIDLAENNKKNKILLINNDDHFSLETHLSNFLNVVNMLNDEVSQNSSNNMEKLSAIVAYISQDKIYVKVMDLLARITNITLLPVIIFIPVDYSREKFYEKLYTLNIDEDSYLLLTWPMKIEDALTQIRHCIYQYNQHKLITNKLNNHNLALKTINSAKFLIQTMQEVEYLSRHISLMYPNPQMVRAGIKQLLQNAVEHGLLSLGFHKKNELILNKSYQEEVIKLQNLPENGDKYVEVVFQKKQKEYYLRISDPGDGFNWREYIKFDSRRALAMNGSSIAIICASVFERVIYNKKGNQVTALMSENVDDAW